MNLIRLKQKALILNNMILCDGMKLLQKVNDMSWNLKKAMNASAAGNVSDTADNGKQNNLVPGLRGPSGAAREAQTLLDVFLCSFNESILEKILIHTNTEIRIKSEKYKTAKATTSQTSRDELLVLFGLLVFSRAQKDNHLSARDMFDYKMSGSIYRATMSCERFNFLIESLRFDDKTTRTERRQLDRFAPIRDIWDEFICNCSHSYKPEGAAHSECIYLASPLDMGLRL
nr:unnamed protein product [Callosobruchus analis]